jgi:hypothetical protein
MQELNTFQRDRVISESDMDPIHVIDMGDTIAISQMDDTGDDEPRLLDIIASHGQAIALRDFLMELFPID